MGILFADEFADNDDICRKIQLKIFYLYKTLNLLQIQRFNICLPCSIKRQGRCEARCNGFWRMPTRSAYPSLVEILRFFHKCQCIELWLIWMQASSVSPKNVIREGTGCRESIDETEGPFCNYGESPATASDTNAPQIVRRTLKMFSADE